MLRIILVAACCLAASTTFAQVSGTYLVARSGRPFTVVKFTAIDPNCVSLGRTEVNLIEAPQGGRLSVGPAMEFLAYPPANPRSACNHRRIAATDVVYRSNPGFIGTDTFVIERIYPTGAATRMRYTLNVR